MKIDLFPICQADLDLYKSWIRLLEAVQVMSRYYPKHFIDTNRIESNACLWMKIVINEPDQASVSIGTIWLERINKKDSLATMGILIGSEEYRGKGIGKIAIEEIILQAINYFNNLTHIKLNVRESNKAAIACYLKSGFKIESKNEKVRNNNKITYYEMIRKIMTDQRNNKYIETANLYDYDVRNTAKDDIDFYFEYANKANGDILELGCGTGRLTIPFAKENFNIWGLDLSCPMLEVIRSKIEN
ncbi:MAG: bifunctional GNAT family N-acetyltransferase/class I SAM-dependent methyltransferase, partial [Candidatus Delongbacteria bacterium]|nr:bifunctional GNAT family N-acetyltransferase/class I SAM-dependent methyltransferase [Candidatus Delongbacteria bacterium]